MRSSGVNADGTHFGLMGEGRHYFGGTAYSLVEEIRLRDAFAPMEGLMAVAVVTHMPTGARSRPRAVAEAAVDLP